MLQQTTERRIRPCATEPIAQPGKRAAVPRILLGDGSLHFDNFQLMRHYHGMTREELGRLLGVSERTVARWEEGTSVPKGERAVKVERFMRATADIMARNDGRVPSELSFKRQLVAQPGADAAAWELAAENAVLRDALERFVLEVEPLLGLLRGTVAGDAFSKDLASGHLLEAVD